MFSFYSSQPRSYQAPGGPGVGWRPAWCISGGQGRPWSASVGRRSRPSGLVSPGGDVCQHQGEASVDSVGSSKAPRFSSVFAFLPCSVAIR